jgi:hypothetical protein
VPNRFDYFSKDLVSTALETCGQVVTDVEVPADPRKVDLWFMPDPSREPVPAYLGLLARLLAGPSALEFFHNTPNGNELAACVIKHGMFRHRLSLRKEPPPIPILWVISAGRPKDGIEGLWLRAMNVNDWPPGLYEGPPLLWTRLVVVSELPPGRSTLLLRLLGADRVLDQAIAELKALEPDAPERTLALPILATLAVGDPHGPGAADQRRSGIPHAYPRHRRDLAQGGGSGGHRTIADRCLRSPLRSETLDETGFTLEPPNPDLLGSPWLEGLGVPPWRGSDEPRAQQDEHERDELVS